MVFLRFTCTMLFAKLLDSELFFISRRILEGEKNGKKIYLHQTGTSTCVFLSEEICNAIFIHLVAWAGRLELDGIIGHFLIWTYMLHTFPGFCTQKNIKNIPPHCAMCNVHGIYISDFSLMLLNIETKRQYSDFHLHVDRIHLTSHWVWNKSFG